MKEKIKDIGSIYGNVSRKIIIDNDAGVDDAWAVFLLLKAKSQHEIMAITCVNGNTSIDNVCNNNLYLLSVLDRTEIPVYKGASSQIIEPETNPIDSADLQYFHGKNGFGDVDLPKKDNLPKLQEENAVSALNRITSRQITLICVGPLTNIALAIKTYSDFSENVKDIFIMGGNYKGIGNTTKCAEFNFHSDPEAAQIVFKEMQNKITLLPWETCLRTDVPFPWREIYGSTGGPVIQFLNLIESPIIRRGKSLNFEHYISCDQLLAAIVIDPTIIKEVFITHATVELAGILTRGQVVLDHLQKNSLGVKIIQFINADKYTKVLQSVNHF